MVESQTARGRTRKMTAASRARLRQSRASMMVGSRSAVSRRKIPETRSTATFSLKRRISAIPGRPTFPRTSPKTVAAASPASSSTRLDRA
jgi:hypothetical protein